MMRKTILWLALGCAGLSLVGCESFPKRKETPATTRSTTAPIPTEGQAESDSAASAGPKGFFKSTRLPGAMSSEGAEIEHSLGVQ
jgi:hypothetical protein